MERQIRKGFIERIPDASQIEQAGLPPILRKQIEEIQFELDELWRHLKQPDRADAPWEANEALKELERLKAVSVKLAKAVE